PHPTPTLDITRLTGATATFGYVANRGILYINDVFRRDPAFGGPPLISPHDFRLAPMARSAVSDAAEWNPMVNHGINFVDAALMPTPFGILTMQNMNFFMDSPGLPQPGPGGPEDHATLDAWDWDWDCEGAGNPRITTRTTLPPNLFPAPSCVGTIDVGA